MSTVIIITPVIISSWPAITAAVAGAAAALGLAVKNEVRLQNQALNQAEVDDSVEIELQESEVLAQNVQTGKEIVLTREGVTLRVRRDERGRCTVCAEGAGKSKGELEELARQFTQKMTQCFVYNRVMSELQNKGFQTVNEEVMADQTVRINVRRWVD